MSTSDPGADEFTFVTPCNWYPSNHDLADKLAAMADALRSTQYVPFVLALSLQIQVVQMEDRDANERRAAVDVLARGLGAEPPFHEVMEATGRRHYVADLEPTFTGNVFTPVPAACLWLGGCENDRWLGGRDPQLCAEHNAQIEGKP